MAVAARVHQPPSRAAATDAGAAAAETRSPNPERRPVDDQQRPAGAPDGQLAIVAAEPEPQVVEVLPAGQRVEVDARGLAGFRVERMDERVAPAPS